MTKTKSRRVLRLPGVQAKTGLGRNAIYRLGKLGEFPRPIKLTATASGWFEDEIDDYLNSRERLTAGKKVATNTTNASS